MGSTNTCQRKLDYVDDTERTDIDASQMEKSQGKEEPAETVQAHSTNIPDGGFFAWLQVAGAFCIFFNTWYVDDVFPVRIAASLPLLTGATHHSGE